MIIYQTTCLINNKKYIGKDSHNDPYYIGSGELLKSDIKKYSKENFKKEIIEYCNTDEELTLRETYWIKYFNAVESDEYYNLVDFSAGWNLDKLGEEKYKFIKEKMSISAQGKSKPKPKGFGIGRVQSQLTKEKISVKNKGKISPKKGKNISEEAKQKISQANKGRKKPDGFGKQLSENEIRKINLSKSIKNKPKPSLNKSVLQYDKQGNFIKEWKSQSEAQKELNMPGGSISIAIKNKWMNGGFIWKFKIN
jgi:group I intron endonuclease